MATVKPSASRLDTFSSGEETEDDGGAALSQLGPPASAELQDEKAVADELIYEKKRAAKRKFSEDMLVGPCGLSRMYETFPRSCRFRGRGFEVVNCFRCIHSCSCCTPILLTD